MGKIVKLNKNISSKIAAGEVIENPGAVIKELVENSIDANSTSITVEIKDAGKSSIRITDDGDGIEEEDVILAFDRHATSKIKTVKDIYKIDTLGFRGEALASVAAVSRLEMTTKTLDSDLGIKININGGEVVDKEKVGCKKGTTIIVNDLFYNTPARIKFLGKNSTEQRRINELMNCLALSNPNISFKYISNDEIKFVTPGKGKLKNVILSVYGKNTAKNVLKIDSSLDNIKVDGFISNLDFTRGNSSLQIFFVNGRYIKSSLIKDAIKTTYKTMIPINRHPVCFLNFEIDSKEIDVNIHPSKTKIKFTKKGIIKQLIYTTIKSKLLEFDQTPSFSLEESAFKKAIEKKPIKDNAVKSDSYKEKIRKLSNNNDIENKTNKDEVKNEMISNNHNKINKNPFGNSKNSIKEEKKFDKKDYNSNNNFIKKLEKEKEQLNIIDLDKFDVDFENLSKIEFENTKEKVKKEETIYDDLRVIGQLFSTYILCEKNNKLYVIDQHAAHEKVLYEELMDKYMNKKINSQLLVLPITIELNYSDLEVILEKKDSLGKLGFDIEVFGKDTLLVREVPILFNKPLKESVVREIILNFKSEYKNAYSTNIDLIIQKSCKNAIKAYDKLDVMEIDKLIDLLKGLESPYTCPHGRPIIISITKNEIEKKFKRK